MTLILKKATVGRIDFDMNCVLPVWLVQTKISSKTFGKVLKSTQTKFSFFPNESE
jgi:hypothetical protein